MWHPHWPHWHREEKLELEECNCAGSNNCESDCDSTDFSGLQIEFLRASNGREDCVNVRVEGGILDGGTLYAVDLPAGIARLLAARVLTALSSNGSKGV